MQCQHINTETIDELEICSDCGCARRAPDELIRAGRHVRFYDYSRPIGKRKSPYHFTSTDVITGRENTPQETGGYLNSNGTLLDEGAFCTLRVIACHNIPDTECRTIRGRFVDHDGWYINDFGETLYGIVARLPKSRGYLAGWTLGGGMCATLDRTHVYDDIGDAAYAADSIAERAAEREREYQEKCGAALRVQELREDIAQLRADHTALIRAVWASEGDNAAGARTRATLRDQVTHCVTEIRDLFDRYGDDIETEYL